jgi:lipopolysaccharide transport system ATP-binding protein
MSDDVIIRAENIGKRYTLNHQGSSGGYRKFSDTLIQAAKAPLRWFQPASSSPQPSQEDFWALKDINFEIKQGEVVGIIGRNGAGKSTLLKILSRITEPTQGRITLNGRVASLLEVGTGFHPELTGRENIYLNGAILGMKKAEIKSKFDEIVAFAEVERFLDTPVKRYSSGMYVRLAFAVAAHLEPEILIVDEVLAVGDTQFQKKCLGKMQDVAVGGRTVLLVSHNLAQLRDLCTKAICLNSGTVVDDDTAQAVISRYLKKPNTSSVKLNKHKYILDVVDHDGANSGVLNFGDKLVLQVKLRSILNGARLGCNLSIRDDSGRLISLFSTNPHDGFEIPSATQLTLSFELEECCLAPGRYIVDVAMTNPGVNIIEEFTHSYEFELVPKKVGGSWAYSGEYGYFFPAHKWSTEILTK